MYENTCSRWNISISFNDAMYQKIFKPIKRSECIFRAYNYYTEQQTLHFNHQKEGSTSVMEYQRIQDNEDVQREKAKNLLDKILLIQEPIQTSYEFTQAAIIKEKSFFCDGY